MKCRSFFSSLIGFSLVVMSTNAFAGAGGSAPDGYGGGGAASAPKGTKSPPTGGGARPTGGGAGSAKADGYGGSNTKSSPVSITKGGGAAVAKPDGYGGRFNTKDLTLGGGSKVALKTDGFGEFGDKATVDKPNFISPLNGFRPDINPELAGNISNVAQTAAIRAAVAAAAAAQVSVVSDVFNKAYYNAVKATYDAAGIDSWNPSTPQPLTTGPMQGQFNMLKDLNPFRANIVKEGFKIADVYYRTDPKFQTIVPGELSAVTAKLMGQDFDFNATQIKGLNNSTIFIGADTQINDINTMLGTDGRLGNGNVGLTLGDQPISEVCNNCLGPYAVPDILQHELIHAGINAIEEDLQIRTTITGGVLTDIEQKALNATSLIRNLSTLSITNIEGIPYSSYINHAYEALAALGPTVLTHPMLMLHIQGSGVASTAEQDRIATMIENSPALNNIMNDLNAYSTANPR